MRGNCFVERQALSRVGVGPEERAALTIGVGLLVYAIALRLLAPDIFQRAFDIGRRLIARAVARRRNKQHLRTRPRAVWADPSRRAQPSASSGRAAGAWRQPPLNGSRGPLP